MRTPSSPPELQTTRRINVAPFSLYSFGPTEICQGLCVNPPYGHTRVFTFKVDVLPLSENNMLPCGNSKDPGVFVLIHNDDGVNYTTDIVGLSIAIKNLVLDYETLVYVAEEADIVSLEDDGHQRWCSLVSCALQGATEGELTW